eukprot:TRINITY_DN48120_c0_g1_i1.p1 TRINITY_DN48120_c0_g1~~TRINITY_DN48120_c0_g1_i1.p1  ORF type:complete len:631 (+),score=117.36 TRINITY_DN48120_c0_g1_i1:136-1893(+)
MASEFEAEIPSDVAPGQTFGVATPEGVVPVQAPPGSRPGQKVRFVSPLVEARPYPVLLGTVVADVGPATSATAAAGSAASAVAPVAAAVPAQVAAPAAPVVAYRVDPYSVQASQLPVLQGIPVKQADRKLESIREGALLAQRWPAFPAEPRVCRDCCWAALFLLLAAAVTAAAVYFGREVHTKLEMESGASLPPLPAMISAGMIGAGASIVAALLLALLAQRAPSCVVWTSLVFSPVLTIVAGFSLLAHGLLALGLICILLGASFLACIFFCFKRLIPFTIKVVETVATVIRENPLMLGVALVVAIVGVLWSVACGFAFLGALVEYEDSLRKTTTAGRYAILFAAVLIFVWGAQVAYNVGHVTYCGVFGRWYFGVERSQALRQSLWAACTTSFGSICFGSLLVAGARALEVVVRQARVDAQEDGNPLCCVVLLVFECIVSCIGDILEYFNDWAYVQCAVRGVSFIEAARITYSLMTCANLHYVVQDLLVDMVVSLGALLCGVVGCASGSLAGLALASGSRQAAVAGAVIGLWAGIVAGGTAVGILSSGTKTILALWAEDPEPLRRARPEVHEDFETLICARLAEF